VTTDSEFKKIVRARMEVTGECYTVAQRACLEAARAAVPDNPPSTERGVHAGNG
jgi:hypothetical protein